MVFSQLVQIYTVQPDVSWSKGGSTMGFGNQRAASWGHKGEFLTLACVPHLPFSTFLITHGCSILIAEEMSCQRPYVTTQRKVISWQTKQQRGAQMSTCAKENERKLQFPNWAKGESKKSVHLPVAICVLLRFDWKMSWSRFAGQGGRPGS